MMKLDKDVEFSMHHQRRMIARLKPIDDLLCELARIGRADGSPRDLRSPHGRIIDQGPTGASQLGMRVEEPMRYELLAMGECLRMLWKSNYDLWMIIRNHYFHERHPQKPSDKKLKMAREILCTLFAFSA